MAERPSDKPLPPRPHSHEPTTPGNRHSRRLSVPSVVHAVFPRRRPERGGTRRDKGYWEAIDDARNDEKQEGQNLAANEPGCLPLTPSSDRLIQWNTPKLIPKNRRLSSTASVAQPPQSSETTKPSLEKGRQRSWTSVSAFRLDSSGHGPTTAPKAAQVPTDKAGHSQRTSSIPHHGCHREERRQIQAQRALADGIMARRRRQRRSLKESGDYLGVQGVNPLTGEPDHITPFSSDERSELSVDTRQGHIHIPRNFTSRNASRDERLVGEVEGESSRHQAKTEAVADTRKQERRMDGSQWSSVQEPNLSPIVQSSLSDAPDADKQREETPLVETDNSSLIEIDSSMPASPVEENPCDSPGGTLTSISDPQDASSCGTVVRPDRRSSSRSPLWAQELHDNGIVFDPTPSDSEQDNEDAGSSPELAQPTGTTDRRERHITFASPPAAPPIRVTRPATPARSLSPSPLKEPGFYKPRPAADPREERCREVKTCSPDTKDGNKETRNVLSERRCSETSFWIRKHILTFATPEECPVKKRLLMDQIALSGVAVLVENRLPGVETSPLLTEMVSADLTLEHVEEGNWTTAQSAIKNTRGLEISRRPYFTNNQRIVIPTDSTNEDPTPSIPDLATMGSMRDLMHDQNEMSASSGEKKKNTAVAGKSRENGSQRKENTCRQQRATDMLKKDHELRPQEAASKEAAQKGSAYTPTTTTTGSDHHIQEDGINKKDEKVQNRHVREALERLRRSKSKSNNRDSRSPPVPSDSSNSQIRPADAQGPDTTSTRERERKRRMTKKEHLERLLDELQTERRVVPTSTSMSAHQPSRTTAPETTDTAASATGLNGLTRAGKNQEWTLQQSGSPAGGGGGCIFLTSGGPRECVVLMVAHLIVFSVKSVRLYWQYLRSCLNPRSELWARMQSGELALLEAVAVALTVGVTFCLSFGLYAMPVYFWDVLKEIWENEMYYY